MALEGDAGPRTRGHAGSLSGCGCCALSALLGTPVSGLGGVGAEAVVSVLPVLSLLFRGRLTSDHIFQHDQSEQAKARCLLAEEGRSQNSSPEIPPLTAFPKGQSMEDEVGASWRVENCLE